MKTTTKKASAKATKATKIKEAPTAVTTTKAAKTATTKAPRIATRITAPTLDSLRPEQRASLLAISHAGALAMDQIHALCWGPLAARTAREGMSALEGFGLATQHHRSVRVGDDTLRRSSIWELTRAGVRLVAEHPQAPSHPAGLDGRTLERAERLGDVLLAIVRGVPDLVGLSVGLRPAIDPKRQRGRADAMVFVHRPLKGAELDAGRAMPWMPRVDREHYRCTALMVELDDELSGEGLRQRGLNYARDNVWEGNTLRLVPRPLWVIADANRQAAVVRNFGRTWDDRWLTVTKAGLGRGDWSAWDGRRKLATGALGEVLGP
jgi:hypothetical protein